jgi:hypothetical protein
VEQHEALRLKLTVPQYEFVFSESKFVAMVGGLGSGKSQAGTFRVIRLMMDDPGISCAYYFPTYDLINLRGIPGLIRDLEAMDIADYSLNKSNYTVHIKDHGDVIFRSYDSPERIVAYEVAHSVVDELDTLPKEKAEYVWRKVVERNRQECSHIHGNTVGCVTTPDQGQMGFVFEKWGGIELQEGYQLIKASTYSNPFLPSDYADNILKNYSEDLARLYLEGEFISLRNRTVFDSKHMQAALQECWKPKKRMVLEKGKFVDRDNGELRVWSEPKPGVRYVLGADVAEGLEKGDYSCAIVREVKTGDQVCEWHGHIAPDKLGEVISALGKWFNNALALVENNNHGLSTLIFLRESGYSNLYVQRRVDDAYSGDVEGVKLGFTTTSKSKPYIIDQMSAELREATHGICSKEVVQEMMTYIVMENGSYGAAPGCFDDRVMAYALSGEALRMSPAYKIKLTSGDVKVATDERLRVSS